jgi:hypothetical protein
MKAPLLFSLAALCSCAEGATIANVAVTVAGDVCKLVAQDDPSAPAWATVACAVEGVVGPVVVTLPWASWSSAAGQTSAMAKARAAVKK